MRNVEVDVDVVVVDVKVHFTIYITEENSLLWWQICSVLITYSVLSYLNVIEWELQKLAYIHLGSAVIG